MKLRRILGLVLAMLMLVTCVCFTANAEDTATATKVVYVSDEAADDGDGLTAEKPFNSIMKALDAVAAEGGIIVLTGNTTFKGKFEKPINGDVVITGVYEDTDYEAVLTFDGNTYFCTGGTGSVKFENLKFWQTTDWKNTYFCNLTVEIGKGVTCTSADGKNRPVFVLGGDGTGNGNAGGKMIVRSGKYFRSIYLGCGRHPKEIADINLEYYGGEVDFYAGFQSAATLEDRPNVLAGFNALIEAQPANPDKFIKFPTNITEIRGAVQILMNNGTAVDYVLPETLVPAGGLYVINSKKGGRVDLTDKPGVFKLSSEDHTLAIISSEEGEVIECELKVNGQECYAEIELAAGTYSVSYIGDAPALDQPYEVVMETVDVYKNNHNIKYNGEIVANAKDGYKLENGTEVPFSINYEGTNYLPARKLSEILGITIGYDDATRTVLVDTKTANETDPTDGIVKGSANSGAAKISVAKNSVIISVDGEKKVSQGENFVTQSATEVPCSLIYEGTTYLPVRKLSELLGVAINYDAATGTVLIGE